MLKLVDHHSPEKDVILSIFDGIELMDRWIAKVIENYIYEKIEETTIPQNCTGTIKCRYSTKYGEKHGKYEEWYHHQNNTQLYKHCHYISGLRDGEYKQWWTTNGQLSIHSHYTLGELNGEYKEYYRNGQLFIQKYFTSGKEEGEFKSWDSNGNLQVQCYFTSGKRDGEYKEYKEDGTLKIQCHYKEGLLHGEYKEWFLVGGHLACTVNYLNGEYHGKHTFYSDYDGKPSETNYYYHGKRIPREDLFTKYRDILGY